MQEPITQIGRLLALSDSLHFQYCKFVRTSEEKRKIGKDDVAHDVAGPRIQDVGDGSGTRVAGAGHHGLVGEVGVCAASGGNVLGPQHVPGAR